MNDRKKKMIQTLFSKGVLVSPNTLSTLEEKELPAILSTQELVVDVTTKKTLTVADYGAYYQEKYNGLRTILTQKLTPISMSNVGQRFGMVEVIGMVREHVSGGVMIEDPTGELKVVTKERPVPGDVIGVRGVLREGMLQAEALISPDLTLPKETRRMNVTLLLTPGAQSTTHTQVVFDGISPTLTEGDGVVVLAYKGSGNPVEWLQKRHFPEQVAGPHDPLIISTVPDVLWVIGTTNTSSAYKGVTIVETDPTSRARVNMFRRTVEFE